MMPVLLLLAALSQQPAPNYLAVFGAQWCPACKAMEPDVDALAKAGWDIARYDVDRDREVCKQFGMVLPDGRVRTLPEVVVVRRRDRYMLWVGGGAMSKAGLVQVMSKWGIGGRVKQ